MQAVEKVIKSCVRAGNVTSAARWLDVMPEDSKLSFEYVQTSL